MSWRTNSCGCRGSVGCSHQPTDLCIVQGEPLSLMLVSPIPVAGEPVRAQIRTAPGGPLILDMAPYCSPDPVDPAVLRVDVPGEATQGVRTSGHYDVWVGQERISHGAALLERSVSAPLLPVVSPVRAGRRI